MLTKTDLARMSAAEGESQSRLKAKVLGLVRREMRDFGGWYVPSDMEALASRIGAHVSGGSSRAAAITSGALAMQAAKLFRRTSRPAPVLDTRVPLRTGVESWKELYLRIGVTYRFERSVGSPDQVALDKALTRLEVMVDDDLMLARTHQAREIATANPRITGTRRLIHPELSRGGSCGLCVAAADRIYYVEDLMPVHERCKCTTALVSDDDDIGYLVNADDVGEVYGAAGSTKGADLKKVRAVIVDHGELGPRLESQVRDRGAERREQGLPVAPVIEVL